jgi:mevalonate kinase
VTTAEGRAPGKCVLAGEHAVVYGHPALAIALPLHVTARVVPGAPPRTLEGEAFAAVAAELGREGVTFEVVASEVPREQGLGSSAALCVAWARALGAADDEQAAHAAFFGERVFHGSPSGVDNWTSALGGAVLFQHGAAERVETPAPLHLAFGLCGPRSTAELLARMRERRERDADRAAAAFAEMGEAARAGAGLLEAGDLAGLGRVMDRCGSLLVSLGVSTPLADALVAAARAAGALGAKLTGAGGGGAVIALCADAPSAARVSSALHASGAAEALSLAAP